MSKLIWLVFLFYLTAQAQTTAEFEAYLKELSTRFDIEQISGDSLPSKDFILLDTREEEEFRVSHIKNAIFAGYDDFELSIVDSLSRDTEIIVYCSVGYRSSKIGMQLIDHGFINVRNLYGGIFKWANEGRPLYDASALTRNIHSYNKHWGRYIVNPAMIKVY